MNPNRFYHRVFTQANPAQNEQANRPAQLFITRIRGRLRTDGMLCAAMGHSAADPGDRCVEVCTGLLLILPGKEFAAVNASARQEAFKNFGATPWEPAPHTVWQEGGMNLETANMESARRTLAFHTH
jgi:hypothetical protein